MTKNLIWSLNWRQSLKIFYFQLNAVVEIFACSHLGLSIFGCICECDDFHCAAEGSSRWCLSVSLDWLKRRLLEKNWKALYCWNKCHVWMIENSVKDFCKCLLMLWMIWYSNAIQTTTVKINVLTCFELFNWRSFFFLPKNCINLLGDHGNKTS